MLRLSLVIGSAMLLLAAAAPLPPGGTFVDDDGSIFEPSIEAIAAENITRGCNPPLRDRFCPDSPVSREQMAAFLSRARSLPAPSNDHFVDDAGSIFEDDINRLAEAGITRGCNPPANDRFCPDALVTRAQMAAFLVRAFHLVGGGDPFLDDDGSVFEADIAALAASGVTKGCNPPANDRFCPNLAVTRAQMAAFLTRAIPLTAITPPPRCTIFPADNVWNTRIDGLPVHARSADFVASIGAAATLHPDFGSGVWPPGSDSPIGIPYAEVGLGQPDVTIVYTAYGSESDPGPFPIPPNAPIEGGPSSSGDRHVIVVDRFNCELFELYSAYPEAGGAWNAASGARYDLSSNALRPDGWTSADAAGLPIFPGLIRYEEVEAGEIDHAIRFTAARTRKAHVWPARHHASNITDASVPPMGQRFRLKSGFDTSGFSPDVQVILEAMKRYGLILADNGADWFISGAPDDRWDNDVLRELNTVPGSAFEAVDVSSLIVDPDRGEADGG
jgi:S-layer homology domain